jgi:hypothetical protein
VDNTTEPSNQAQSQSQHVPVTQTIEQQTSTGRWWENYLVRYLVPTIVGMGCLQWLSLNSGVGLSAWIAAPANMKELNSEQLLVWFLFGLFFCYVASYPVLIFHATRMMDFKGEAGRIRWINGFFTSYGAVAVTALLALLAAIFTIRWLGIIIVVCFAGIQIYRLCATTKNFYKVPEKSWAARTWAYSFYIHLAERRGGANRKNTPDGTPSPETRAELVESYRHLREHGNSALIVILELILTGLIYSVIATKNQISEHALSWLAIMLVIWCSPAAFIHMFAQQLERRFAYYDDKQHRPKATANPIDKQTRADASPPSQ